MGIRKKKPKRRKQDAVMVYDTVFRTAMEKLPRFVLALLREVFGTDFREGTTVTLLSDEFMKVTGGRIIADSVIRVDGKLYHIECQSNADAIMAIRMFEYDSLIAADQARNVSEKPRKLVYPHSCVLYLRHNEKTPCRLKLGLVFPDGTENTYNVPVIKAQEYELDDIFEKDLYMFLPYYILRYEKELADIDSDKERLRALTDEYAGICDRMISACEEGRLTDYEKNYLLESTGKVLDAVTGNARNIRKGVATMLRGKVISLPIDKPYNEGRAVGRVEGKAEGKVEGRAEGRTEGIRIGEARLMCTLVQKGRMTKEEAAEEFGDSFEKIEALALEY